MWIYNGWHLAVILTQADRSQKETKLFLMRLAASYCVVVGTKSDDFVDYSYQVNDEDDVIIGSVIHW